MNFNKTSTSNLICTIFGYVFSFLVVKFFPLDNVNQLGVHFV